VFFYNLLIFWTRKVPFDGIFEIISRILLQKKQKKNP